MSVVRVRTGYPTYSCLCISAIDKAGKEFKKHPFKYSRFIWNALFSRKKILIVFGKDDDLQLEKDAKFISVGSCAKSFADRHGVGCLDKCPTGIEETRAYLQNSS